MVLGERSKWDVDVGSQFFSDDAEVPKNILNGTVTSRILGRLLLMLFAFKQHVAEAFIPSIFFSFLANPIDKNIRLAPNKSVFSSPSYGKRTEDGKSSQSTQQHHSNRHRHNVCIGGKWQIESICRKRRR